MLPVRHFLTIAVFLLWAALLPAQVIEYENNGIRYQTATRAGLTVILSQLQGNVAGFAMVQVSISNGSQAARIIRPEDFAFVRSADSATAALAAGQVVDMLLGKASHNDVVKLVASYESALYGIPNMRSTNGYEQRRQSMMSYGMGSRFKAAATASAIALSNTRLMPGQSTDGAVFIPLARDAKVLMGGRIVFRCGGETFSFNPS